MKISFSIVTVAVSLSLLASAAKAQVPTEQPPPAATQTINLTVENRHVIKEIVKDMHVQSASGEIDLTVGAKVPQSVALQPMPARVAEKVPQVKSHVFFVKNEQIVLVDSKDNKIVEVIE